MKAIWREAAPRASGKPEQTLLRGRVLRQERDGVWIRGRFFVERADTMSVRELPREKDGEDRTYFVPWSSVEAFEIVVEGTREYELHELVRSRR